ncbi:MAG: RraA family protein [Nitrospinota bacterium]
MDPLAEARAFLALSTTNVSDALDRLGIAGAPLGIRPLWPGCKRIAGRAMTMRLVAEGKDSPVNGTLGAIQAARPGEVLVIDHGGRMDVNSGGGIAMFTANQRGLAGVVIDGVSRDVDECQEMGFPVYARGVIQTSIRGRCAFGGHGVEARLAGVPVRPGDLVMGDENGVVVVPQESLAEALGLAQELCRMEEQVKAWIREGVDPVEAHERARYDRATRKAG